MDGEDDPVIAEYDVYLSKQLSEQLYLIQYPLRPVFRPYLSRHVEAARCKPQQQRIEMDLALDTHSPNYARSKGEQIAINVDGNAPSDKHYYDSDKMDRHSLSSAPARPDKRYVIGFMRDQELHLTPLKGILQMKPTFGYMDVADERKKGDDAEAAEGSQDEEAPEPEAKPVMMKFARHETDEAKARRMASYEHLRKTREAESWVPLKHYEASHPLAQAQRGLLVAPQAMEEGGQEGSEFHMSQGEYLQCLVPSAAQQAKQRPALPNNVLSMTELRGMSLSDQVRALLLNAKVIRFSQLMALLSHGTDPAAALRCVQQFALLVQGCWVVKSDVLYPEDAAASAHSGVPAQALRRGRDYIMWRYTQNRCLVRKDVSSVVRLPAEDVKAILEQMARLRVNCGWEFNTEYDAEFVNRHPEVVQRQSMLWNQIFEGLASVLSISKADRKMAANAASATAALSPKRRRTASSRSRTKSCGFSDQSDTDGENAKDQRRRRRSSSGQGAFRNSEPSNGSLVKVMSQPDAADLNSAVEAFVRERLGQRVVLSLHELRMNLNLRLSELPAGHILGSGVSEKQLEQAVCAIGGRRFVATAAEGGPIFGLLKTGDELDKVREVVVQLLDCKPNIRINALKRRLEEMEIPVPDDAELKKVLKEICVTHKSAWHLKGTVPIDGL